MGARLASEMKKTLKPPYFVPTCRHVLQESDRPALLIRLLGVLLGFAAFSGTCFDSLVP
jgi:hypothetical protein